MDKRASSQASWSLLTEGVSGARVEAHLVRSSLNQILTALEDHPKVKEAMYRLCGDSFAAIPLHLSKLERGLDRTNYALITMGEAFYRQQLSHEDRELVDQASKFNPTPEPHIVHESENPMRRSATLDPQELFLTAENEVEEAINDSSDQMLYDYRIIRSAKNLEIRFNEVEFIPPRAMEHEYITYTANDQAHYLWETYLVNRRGVSRIPGLEVQVRGGSLFFTPTVSPFNMRASSMRVAARVICATSPKEVIRALAQIQGVEDIELDDDVVSFVMDKFTNEQVERDVKRVLMTLKDRVKFETGSFTGLGLVHLKP